MEENINDFLKMINFHDDIIKKPENENTIILAFLGDAIFDLFSRDLIIQRYNKTLKINDIHKKNTEIVCAHSQAKIIDFFISENFLTDEELFIYKHGRNIHMHSKSRNSSIVEYRKATGFETLLGYLYYKKQYPRIYEIFKKIDGYI